MQITKKQIKHFHRINEKLKTNSLFFITNHSYLAKKYSYLKKSHCIVKCQLKLKRQKVVLSFNQLIRLGLNRSEDKDGKKQHSKNLQKKCHVRSKTETVHKKNLQKLKPNSVARVINTADADDTVSTQNKDADSVAIVTSPKPIEEKTPTENEKVLELPTAERDEDKNVPTTTEDVNGQIREQLKLLQSGRRTSITLLTNNSSSTRPSSVIGTKTSSCSSTPSYRRHPSQSSLENESIKSTDEKSFKSNGVTGSLQNISNQKPKFIDSLISKLRTQGLNLPASNTEDVQSLSEQTSPEKSISSLPEKSPTNLLQKSFTLNEAVSSMDVDDDQLSDHSTSSENGFLGFKEDEAQFERPNIPGMLPTPVVRKSKGVKSAFVSEELDNFMKENALDNSAYTTAPLKKRHDEAMMYAEAEPPSLLCPQLPSDVEKPRTVAEKRQLLERKADIKYLMIENESTVYRELRKRAKTGPLPNYTLIRNIQQMNIPFTRDCWRATCWLNTPNGRFYYQTIQDNGKEVKVLGGRGNNGVKELVRLKPIDKKKFSHQDCGKSCKLIGNIKINGLDELITESTNHQSEPTFTSKKLNTLADGYSFQKPGPLSLKKLNPIKSSIDVELGPLELYNLPNIQLEVWPKLDRPLPEVVHPYLKLALPYQKITPEWAEFALSTLKQNPPPPSRRKRKRTTETADANRSYTFNIPYTNNQNRILVRKRRQIVPAKLTKLNSITETEKTEFSFLKNVDRTDDVAVAVADALTGMINSVALTLCEGTVIKEDPDIDYSRVDGQVGSGDNKVVGINAVDAKKMNTPAGKVVKELKKLNAKIIHGFDTVKREDCRNAFCKLGCICDSLRGAQTYSYHCKQVNCMFQCKCPSSKVNTSTFESAVHNSDIKQFCDRMNASLAKEEKDFTATVVVSDGKTIYVPTWDEKKKRLKKVPKRLSDCVQFESDFVHRDVSETLMTKQEKRMRASKVEDVISVDDRALSTNKNDIVKNMVHVNVNVERLNVLDNLQPWCMIHGLYKCFCKLRAIDGQRFEFGDAKIDVIEQPTYTKKRQYTFERSKDEPANKVTNCSMYTPNEDYYSCRRVRVVATNHHKIVNRARSEDIRRRINKIERDHPGLKVLLRNRVKRSIALAEVGSMITVGDSYKDTSRISNDNQSITEIKKSSHSMGRGVMDQSVEMPSTSSSLPVNDSFKMDANENKYRSRFNNIIMKTMQGISQKLKTMTTLPSPVNKAFYYMQWKHFLQAFNSDRIYIWEVQLNTKEVLLVVTDKNIMPIVSNAMYVINIKAVSSERLPLLPKLIKLGVVNEETKKMSILLFGISNYWRVLGCTHSENDFLNNRVVAVPTPDTNPRLASKISSLFNDMVKLTSTNRSKPPSITSNICIRQLDVADIDKIHVPIPVVGCHRWLMLSMANDFSHIYVPAWKQFISYKKIMSAIDHAKKSQRTVRWGPTDLKPQVYVPHNSDKKIFFGPMQKNERLDLQLLQQCEGKMLLREDYQRMTKQKPNVVTVGTWLYMKGDHMIVGDDTKLRSHPPKLKYFSPKPSTSSAQEFIPLKPSSTVTSSNMNITLMSPTSSEGLSNLMSTSPSTSTSGNNPSSEFIRHISLGLRARPAKVLNQPNAESSPIKVVDTKLLMSPEFISASTSSSLITSTPTSSAATSSHSTKQDQPIASSIQSKPITLSFVPKMQSNADWKDISKGVPIRTRRFTTIVTNDRPTVKNLLQKPTVDKPDKELAPNAEISNLEISKPKPKGIRERRYTTIVSSGTQPLPSKNIFQNFRPPVNVKNFELVQNPGNKLTLAPIPAKESPTQLILNRPVIIKKLDAADSVVQSTSLRQRSKSFNRSNPPQKYRASDNQTSVRPVNSTHPTTSTVVSKLSTAPVVVVKPSSLNLNLPGKVPDKSIALDGKSIVMKKLNNVPTLRLMSSNMKILGKNRIVKTIAEPTQVIDIDDDIPTVPRKQQTSVNALSTGTNNTVNGYLICQVRGVGKIMAKKLFAAYSVNLLGGSKLFHTFKHCTEYLSNIYVKEHIFAMVPTHLVIEWKFVANEEDHCNYKLHDENTLRMSMVLTKDELIDLESDFDSNDRFSMDLRHHLLVLRLAHACMKNFEARHKTGLEIVRKSEAVVKELKTENKKLESTLSALRIEKHLNVLKLNELKKKKTLGSDKASEAPFTMEQADEVITIDSDDE